MMEQKAKQEESQYGSVPSEDNSCGIHHHSREKERTESSLAL